MTFDSIKNANDCFSSQLLKSNRYNYSIPSSLLFRFGVIRLENVSEEDFWDGYESLVKFFAFRRMTIKKNGNLIPTRFAEINFLSSSCQKTLVFPKFYLAFHSAYGPPRNVMCLRFDHTQKYCRGKV